MHYGLLYFLSSWPLPDEHLEPEMHCFLTHANSKVLQFAVAFLATACLPFVSHLLYTDLTASFSPMLLLICETATPFLSLQFFPP